MTVGKGKRSQIGGKCRKSPVGEKEGRHMTYTVVGYPIGTMDTVTLHTRLLSHRLADLVQKISILTIGSDDIETVESRFGTGFANFILLDDPAIAACKAVDFSIAPPGTVLGLIDEAELRSPLPVLPIRRL